MTRRARRAYPRHIGDAIDRFLTEHCRGESGRFSMDRMIALAASLDMPDDAIPAEGSNGTRRMMLGHAMRNWFPDGVLRFRNGVTLELEESK